MKWMILILPVLAALPMATAAGDFTSASHPGGSSAAEGLVLGCFSPASPPSPTDDWTSQTNAPILASPKMADLTGDGTPEILLTTYDTVNPYGGGWLHAWTGAGSELPGFPLHLSGAPPATPAVGDLDGDGDPEIVQGTWQQLYVLGADGTPFPGWPQAMYLTQSAALADLDGNGDLEIIVPSSTQMRAYHHTGAAVAGFPVTGAHDLTAAAVGDLDGDGDLEIVAGSFVGSGSPTDYIYAWHHTGQAVAGFPFTTAGSVKVSPALGDLDGDGTLEIVADCWVQVGTDQLYVLSHTGQPEPGWPLEIPYIRLSSPSLTNLDYEGDLEIIVGGMSSSPAGEKVYAYHHDGTAVDGFPVVLTNPGAGNVNSTCVTGNLDTDWHPEIVIKGKDHIFALNHDGVPVTGFPVFLSDENHTGTTSPTPCIGDPDGDGLAEIFAASCFNSVTLLDQPGTHCAAAYRWPAFRQNTANAGLLVLPVAVTLNPAGPPIVIPAGGGWFDYTAGITNQSSTAQTLHVWINTIYPLPVQPPVVGPAAVTLPAGASILRNRSQYVPSTAPPGTYLYCGRLGQYPQWWQQDSFTFLKQGAGYGGLGMGDGWISAGDPFPGEGSQTPLIPSGLTLSVSPNPFNPQTALSYRLSAPGYVTLRVYDTAGREVARLVDGWREAGSHQATFDGAGLPSGLYFARLTAGDFTQTQKLILLK